MDLESLKSLLTQRGLKYDLKEQEHCTQLKVKSGEVVNFYHSGKVVVQGKKTDLYHELTAWKDGSSEAGIGPDSSGPIQPEPGPNKDIFVVYGHDTAARDSVELLLRRLGLNPIVLANLPAAGDTIIEKLERYLHKSGDVGFACVLLTPDDCGHPAKAPESEKPRARQNVILELGMVLANLGRRRVAIIYQESVEQPSDIGGLLYLPFKDSVTEVKSSLFRELKAAGYILDSSAL